MYSTCIVRSKLHAALFLSLVPARRGSGDLQLFLGIHEKFIACCMQSRELIINLRTKKVLCHHTEVAKNFGAALQIVFLSFLTVGKFSAESNQH